MAYFLISLLFFLVSFGFSSSSMVSREVFPMEGNIAWVVQVSDLHISAYHHDRAEDLDRLLGPALRIIRPHLLLITGDITDAKNRKRTSTRQDESEWIQYKRSMDAVVRQGGIEKRRIFDIRGNHDKYGVPYAGSSLDFFSSYSISSQLNRLSNIHSISLVGDDRTYMFLGIDDTMHIGIRGPSNLFGHPTDDHINTIESELRYWENTHPNSSVTKVVFGHFPMSFTASSKKGQRYETIFAKQSISGYICGHLHAKFSKQLWKRHSVKVADTVKKQFWEWELGDWKEFKLIRILSIDEGQVSFADMELSNKQNDFPTTILITYPTDSRSMNRLDAEPQTQLLRNDINTLVFSALPIRNVTAKVFDSSRAFKIVEEIPLLPAIFDSSIDNKPLYQAKWNAENYRNDPSAARYWLQVFVLDSQGKETQSALRPFSVEGKVAAEYPTTLLVHLVFRIRWEALYSILLWGNLCFLFIFLSLPKLLNQFMDRSVSYQKWAASVSVSSPVQQRRVLFSVLWVLIEGSRNKALWCCMVFYLLWLVRLPWFWGHMTSENGDIATMYIFGWSVNSPYTMNLMGLGNPDVLTITLPFMYFVVTPLMLLIYCLCAERSAACFQASARKTVESEQRVAKTMRTKRRVLLLACAIFTCIHFKQCCSLMRFYGAGTVALSPAFSWAPPLLLATAIYSTS
ncbi:putative metallophosphoesterase At3g03305 [Asparagus officinalis]|nr:putative metallophosphoesterase At3g03305 [Asparagus officinalis]